MKKPGKNGANGEESKNKQGEDASNAKPTKKKESEKSEIVIESEVPIVNDGSFLETALKRLTGEDEAPSKEGQAA